jgi:hypothetical protein
LRTKGAFDDRGQGVCHFRRLEGHEWILVTSLELDSSQTEEKESNGSCSLGCSNFTGKVSNGSIRPAARGVFGLGDVRVTSVVGWSSELSSEVVDVSLRMRLRA